MPYIKCPYCAYRIMQPMVVNLCPNCGRGLSGEEPVNASEVPQMATALSRRPDPRPRSETSPEEKTSTVSSEPPEHRRRGSRPEGSMRKRSSRPPNIEGTVVAIHTQNDAPPARNLIGDFFKGVSYIIWPETQSHSNKTVVTQVRVRINDVTQRDARIHGTLTGASISLGDHIALWGVYRKGALIVRRAYNHTSDAAIITRHLSSSSSSFLLLLVSLIGLLAGVYMLVTHWR